MTDELLPFASRDYWIMFAVLVFARAMDFLSTWVATPRLILEGNPIAKKLGWRNGAIVNLLFCFAAALWPLPALMVSTMSVLVAARNFQSAWMMRSMGETNYAVWIHERMITVSPTLFAASILAQSTLTALVGAAIMLYSRLASIPFAIGAGITGYAIIVLVFSLYALWRTRRH